MKINGNTYSNIVYYGGTPIVGNAYRVFVPFGNMSQAFTLIFADTSPGESGVQSVNGKTGDVVLTAVDVGALPSGTKIPNKTSDLINDSGYITESAIPTKTSQLDNDSGFVTSAPVTSVNDKTGDVTLSATDVSAIPSTLTGTAGQVLTKTADGQEWKDVEIPSGTNDHAKLSNRDAADQHPIGAITGLEAALAGKQPVGDYLTNEALAGAVDDALAQAKASGAFDGAPGADGKSAYTYAVEAGYTGTEAEFSARMAAEIPTVDGTLTKSGQAADAAAVRKELDSLSEEIANIPGGGSGLTTAQVNALDGMFKVAAYIKADVSAEYSAFKTAFGITEPEKTLTSISATYSGGDVAVGTAVTDLTGIVVTAHYSDGTSATVTGYTLSGTIAEGSNNITVTYGGMTTTFTVTGVTGSGDVNDNVSDDTQWTNGVAYKYTVVADEYVSTTDGSFVSYSGWCRTPYLKCDGASKLRAIAKVESSALLTTGANTSYNAFYDENKSFIQSFSFLFASGYAVGDCIDIAVPENAVYFILSGPKTSIGTVTSSGKPIVDFIPYA